MQLDRTVCCCRSPLIMLLFKDGRRLFANVQPMYVNTCRYPISNFCTQLDRCLHSLITASASHHYMQILVAFFVVLAINFQFNISVRKRHGSTRTFTSSYSQVFIQLLVATVAMLHNALNNFVFCSIYFHCEAEIQN